MASRNSRILFASSLLVMVAGQACGDGAPVVPPLPWYPADGDPASTGDAGLTADGASGDGASGDGSSNGDGATNGDGASGDGSSNDDAGLPGDGDAGETLADAGDDTPDASSDDDAGEPTALRDVLMVGNGVAGTVSFMDVATFENLGSVNIIPDIDERLAEIEADLVRSIAYPIVKNQQLIHHFEPSEGNRFIDDLFVSPDGKVLYASRSNLGDVAAFDLTKPDHPLLWRTRVDGLKADHATISPDGAKLIVSATTAQVADVFDAKTGELISSFPTGYYPHQNDYSHDGKHIYNSSIGNVGYGSVPYALNDLKGDRWLVKVNAETLEIVDTWEFAFGIRPSVITPDEKIFYAQLSYLNGVIKYDLETKQEIGRSEQELSPFALETYKTYDEYPHDSAHHGLSISGDGKKLCDCGTIDNTVAIVDTDTMEVRTMIDVGMVPYWSTTSPDGKTCFVSLSGDDAISVIDFEQEEEVKVVPTGNFPQRSRLGRVPESVLELLLPEPG